MTPRTNGEPNLVEIVVNEAVEMDFLEGVQRLADEYPGDTSLGFEIQTSEGTRYAMLDNKIKPCEGFYQGVRDFGWVAIPRWMEETE